jgi:hypothetical protein
MTLAYQIRWLKADDYSGTAKQFAHYCIDHIQDYTSSTDVDQKTLEEAIKLALATLQTVQAKKIKEDARGDV